MTFILGINAFHGDSSACLVHDGELVAAAEEERFRRIKHWAGFPSESIRYCLAEAGITLGDVAHVAINQDARASLGRKIWYTLTQRPDVRMVLDRLRNKRKRTGIETQLAQAFPGQAFRGQVHAVEHHLAHLSSAFHVSPFEEAVAVSVDGFGDFASAAWGVGRGTDIEVDGRVHFPHSLGIFYQALTQFLGFPHYGDEYKVMGLAPYGEPKNLDAMRQIVHLQADGSFRLNLKYFRHHREKIAYEWDNGIPVFGELFSPALAELLGPARSKDDPLEQKHKDIARSVQAMYEEAFFHLLNTLHARHKLDAVAVAGGCGMNSVANGKIALKTPFRQVYVQSAAGDAGGAIGAAYSVWFALNPSPSPQPPAAKGEGAMTPSPLAGEGGGEGEAHKRFHMDHAYWGPSFSDAVIGELLTARAAELTAQGCTVERISDEAELCRRTAAAIADGLVIGWFQGRMEWGPRALGNRSILGDPRRADMKDILNLKIKRRESFRPFAPSVLREAVPDWFEQDADVPFMMQVFQIREEQRPRTPAVTHVDGSGRLQTVSRDTNPRYHRLISAFREQTGVPMVLNTSFNENEPVVCKPEEALDCFLRTKMDVLVLGDWLVRRQANHG
ncbi:MAG: carbamoyltransferase [Thiobacillus sp.]|nr:carbamoyltransferase [Thiobacillus sp.]